MAVALGDARNRKFEYLARLGYGARGLIYVIVGWLALMAAFGTGGQTTDTQGALRTILGQPYGKVLLGIVGAGLIGFALWRAVQAIKDVDHHGGEAKGLAIRGGFGVSAVNDLLLAALAFSLIFTISLPGAGGGGGGGGDSSTQDWTATLLRQPFGQWLVGLIGLAVVGAGIAQFVKGYRQTYERYLDMRRHELDKVAPICMFGLMARGVVFLIIGGFLIVAAYQADPGEARELAGALRTVQEQPWGWALLGVVGLGLIAFGVYSLIEAVYRRVDMPEPV